MTDHNHLIHPTKCFCQIPDKEIKKWAVKRYIENIPTVELLKSAKNDSEKETVSAVALIDVDDETLLQMMENVDFSKHHILHCRAEAKEMIEALKNE